MKFSSDKFNEVRENYSFIGGKQKQTITFNKFIKKVKQDMKTDPKLEIAAQFEFYSVNCEDCQRERSKVVEMYLLSSQELQIEIANNQDIDEDRPDLILRCPECFKEKRVIDQRKHIAIASIEPLNEIVGAGGMYNVSFGRNKDDPLQSFDEDIRDRLKALMDMPTMNKEAKKQLERYVKNYAAIVKKIPKALTKDYATLLNTGSQLTKVENIRLA
jgi:Zn finger protein HypA/HybF involved in hydrogenase expression